MVHSWLWTRECSLVGPETFRLPLVQSVLGGESQNILVFGYTILFMSSRFTTSSCIVPLNWLWSSSFSLRDSFIDSWFSVLFFVSILFTLPLLRMKVVLCYRVRDVIFPFTSFLWCTLVVLFTVLYLFRWTPRQVPSEYPVQFLKVEIRFLLTFCIFVPSGH